MPRQTAALIRRIARNKMRHDANASRWKRHLEHLRPSGWSLSRLQWQTAVSSLRGGAARVPLWTSLPATSHHEDGMTFIFPACELCLQYDREHLRHVLARLHQPASSFLVFSKAAP